MIVAGDLNVDLEKEGGQVRDEEITAAVVTAGLEDLAGHFFPRGQVWCRDRRTWAAVRQGMVVRSLTDYILISDRRIFQNVAIRDPRHNYDHFMVVGYLRGYSLSEHSHYLRCRTRLPLRPSERQTRMQVDKFFTEFRRSAPKPDKRTARPNS